VVGWDDSYTLGPDEAVEYSGTIGFFAFNLTTRYATARLRSVSPDIQLAETNVDFTAGSGNNQFQTAPLRVIWAPGPGTYSTNLHVQTAVGTVNMYFLTTAIQRRIIYWPAGKVTLLTPTWS
jgi:hypothetical protein